MRDYVFHAENGATVPVSDMSNKDIDECLLNGVEADVEKVEDAMERLRIEKRIRELGLR